MALFYQGPPTESVPEPLEGLQGEAGQAACMSPGYCLTHPTLNLDLTV